MASDDMEHSRLGWIIGNFQDFIHGFGIQTIFLGEFGSAPAESCKMCYLLNRSLSRGVKLYTSTKYFSSFSLTSYSFMNRTKILCLSYDKKDFKFGIFLQEIFQ